MNMNKIILKKKATYIKKLLAVLASDPFTTEDHANYPEWEEMLYELYEKDKSVTSGILYSIEQHLEK